MSGERVIITGAASGIGAASMAELRRRGALVVGLDRNAEQEGLIECDVREQASVDQAVSEAIFAPRRFVDWVILEQLGKKMKGRSFDGAAPPVAEFATRLAAHAPRRQS